MDELVQQLESASISDWKTEREKSNNENTEKTTGNQNNRRKEILETQSHDDQTANKSRSILALVEAMEKEMMRTKRDKWRPSVYLHGFDQAVDYCNILSSAEWMLEKPDDFTENWAMVPCPKGTRMLVIAYNGTTRFFSKYGYLKFERSTSLPGGNYRDMIKNTKSCVLDCFYYKDQNTMFVLDILSFNNHMMSYAEAGARQYWLETSIGTNAELSQYTEANHMIFKLLPKLPCTTESLEGFLSVYPYFDNNQPFVDGLMFYHTKAKYFSGETPMVGWLYPYMMPELLKEDLNIHKGYLLDKPVDYVNYLDFIRKFEARPRRKKQRRILDLSAIDAMMTFDAEADFSVAMNEPTDEGEAQRLDIAAGPVPAAYNFTEPSKPRKIKKCKLFDGFLEWEQRLDIAAGPVPAADNFTEPCQPRKIKECKIFDGFLEWEQRLDIAAGPVPAEDNFTEPCQPRKIKQCKIFDGFLEWEQPDIETRARAVPRKDPPVIRNPPARK